MAAIKFNTLTFDVKDLLLICGLVAGYFRFEQKQTDMYNDLKAQIQQIVSDNKIQEVKFNARFASEVSSNAIVAKAGSIVCYQQVL